MPTLVKCFTKCLVVYMPIILIVMVCGVTLAYSFLIRPTSTKCLPIRRCIFFIAVYIYNLICSEFRMCVGCIRKYPLVDFRFCKQSLTRTRQQRAAVEKIALGAPTHCSVPKVGLSEEEECVRVRIHTENGAEYTQHLREGE